MAKKDAKPKKSGSVLLRLVMLFYFLAFLLLGLRDGDTIINAEKTVHVLIFHLPDGAWLAYSLALIVPILIALTVRALPKLFPGDPLLLTLTSFLCCLGILVLFRLDHEKGLTQAAYYLVGMFAMLCVTQFVRLIRHWAFPVFLMFGASIVLLLLPIVMGTEKNGAKNWVTIAGFGFQPSELVKLSLLVILSYCLSRRKLIYAILFTGMALILLMLQKDLGTALLYYGAALVLLYASTGSMLLVGTGILGGAAASVIGYNMFAHVRKRIAIWIDPWTDYQGAGYQIVKGLIAIANGGLLGVGLGCGNASEIPEAYNDYIFPVILHEFGAVFGVLVLLIYLIIVLRAVSVARRADDAFHALLPLGCAALLALQVFVIVGGNLKLIPLTGVTLPFVSYGGTSLVSSLCVIGLIQGVEAYEDMRVKEDKRLAMYDREEADE